MKDKNSLGEVGEYFDYLVELRDSGEINMWGASAYLSRDFGLSDKEAAEIFFMWKNSLERKND